MRKRGLAKRAAVKSPEKWSVHKQLRNAVAKKIKLVIQSYYHGIANEHQHNTKKLWRIFNTVLDRFSNSAVPTSLAIDRKKLNRDRDILQALNHYFVSVGPKLANQIEQNSNDDPLKHIAQEVRLMSLTPVHCNYVRKAIQQPKNGKAPGPEKISIILIKGVTDLIS